ncbi:hypothetical protein OG885_00040 [Streptomyces sp. NBC_00028]|uniref:hypothetical protein n=1 Tax=Streptomyces sp. NBC_00028 TaxID=2975624 RepID=UPI003249CE3C
MGPERLAAKIRAYERLFTYVPVTAGRARAPMRETLAEEDWWRRYPIFPRLLFVLDGTGPTGVANRLTALTASARLTGPVFRASVPIYTASLTDLLHDGPSAPVWQPATTPQQRVRWTDSQSD